MSTAKKKPESAAATGSSGSNPLAASIVALTRQHITKITGKKEVVPTFATLPHIDSGSIIVNGLIGGSMARDGKGRVCPGYPRRKMTEIFGPESSGKTTIALSAAVEVQKAGGVVMFLDFEHALHHGYAQAIGVKFDETFMVYAPDTLEEGLKMLFVGISVGVDLIIVDSVAAMVPAYEMEKKLDDAAKIGIVAAKMAQNLPKICTWLATFPKTGTGENKKPDPTKPGTALILLNQERAKIETGGHGGADSVNTTGGKAVKFYASLRIRFSRIGSEMVERKDPMTGKAKKFPYGNKTQVKIIKNKLDGTQGQSGEFFIRYGYGLDNYYSIIETGVVTGVMKKAGASYSYGENSVVGRDKFRAWLIENPKVYAEIAAKVTDSLSSTATAIADEEIDDGDSFVSEMNEELGTSVVSSDEEETIVTDDE